MEVSANCREFWAGSGDHSEKVLLEDLGVNMVPAPGFQIRFSNIPFPVDITRSFMELLAVRRHGIGMSSFCLRFWSDPCDALVLRDVSSSSFFYRKSFLTHLLQLNHYLIIWTSLWISEHKESKSFFHARPCRWGDGM